MKKYKVKLTADYTEYKKWADRGDEYWIDKIKENPEMVVLSEKWSGKEIELNDIPEFIKEVGGCVISENEIEIYNDYRE